MEEQNVAESGLQLVLSDLSEILIDAGDHEVPGRPVQRLA